MEKRDTKVVRFGKYDELKNIHDLTGIEMSKLLERAWEHYKGTKDYATLVLFSERRS